MNTRTPIVAIDSMTMCAKSEPAAATTIRFVINSRSFYSHVYRQIHIVTTAENDVSGHGVHQIRVHSIGNGHAGQYGIRCGVT